MERLETYIREGLDVMRDDFERTKQTLQKEKEDYVLERNYLSPKSKRLILQEAKQGEFRMPNWQKGYTVASYTVYARHQLDQYT